MNQQAPSIRRPATYQDVLDGAGIAGLWLIDPVDRTLEAFALGPGGWMLIAALKNDDEARVPPFDAMGFPLSVLWPD